MKRKDKTSGRLFWCSLGMSLSLLLAVGGIVVVDYQGRRLSFGDDTPPFRVADKPGNRVELEMDLLGVEKAWDVTGIDEFWKFLCDFGCIPHK